jgi:hypothetical protein
MAKVSYTERSGKLERALKLENPARKAAIIKEITGSIELLAPARDAQSVFAIKNVGAQMGRPLSAPTLKANSIEITAMNKAQFEAMRKAQEAKNTAAGNTNPGEALGKAFGDAFKQLFSGFM